MTEGLAILTKVALREPVNVTSSFELDYLLHGSHKFTSACRYNIRTTIAQFLTFNPTFTLRCGSWIYYRNYLRFEQRKINCNYLHKEKIFDMIVGGHGTQISMRKAQLTCHPLLSTHFINISFFFLNRCMHFIHP